MGRLISMIMLDCGRSTQFANSNCNESDAVGGISHAPVVRNISSTDMLLETEQTVDMDQTIHIDLGAAGSQEAQVRWVDGNLMGCEFPETLPKSRIGAALLQRDHHNQDHTDTTAILPTPLAHSSERRNFGLAIAWARKVKGVNQTELARAIGVSTTTICKWENGHAKPRKAALSRLQNYLKDVEASADKAIHSRGKSPSSLKKGIPLITSEYRAKLADHLGLELEAIEVHITIKDVMDRKRGHARR